MQFVLQIAKSTVIVSPFPKMPKHFGDPEGIKRTERFASCFRLGAVYSYSTRSPKTQSALLEVMEEQQVTVDGTTYPMPRPFHDMATSNPVEYEGTYPLPEAQLDRFLLKLTLPAPERDQEIEVLRRHANAFDPRDLVIYAVTVVVCAVVDAAWRAWTRRRAMRAGGGPAEE